MISRAALTSSPAPNWRACRSGSAAIAALQLERDAAVSSCNHCEVSSPTASCAVGARDSSNCRTGRAEDAGRMLAFASATRAGLRSKLLTRAPTSNAALTVVPEPQKGSTTRPPSGGSRRLRASTANDREYAAWNFSQPSTPRRSPDRTFADGSGSRCSDTAEMFAICKRASRARNLGPGSKPFLATSIRGLME